MSDEEFLRKLNIVPEEFPAPPLRCPDAENAIEISIETDGETVFMTRQALNMLVQANQTLAADCRVFAAAWEKARAEQASAVERAAADVALAQKAQADAERAAGGWRAALIIVAIGLLGIAAWTVAQ